MTGTFTDPNGQPCSGGVSATVKIRIKWFDINDNELDENNHIIPAGTSDTDYSRYERTINTPDPVGGVGTASVDGTTSFDGYYWVWYIKPADAAYAVRLYRVYGSAGSQDARASKDTNKQSNSKATRFMRLHDGTGPDESPLQ